ncbi:hypothetical protein TcBrA4_0092830 [Trypanosoma cruzi]|nr:hypothetical protein TcBrA4_0092830 [Trypanosoma cruzi]
MDAPRCVDSEERAVRSCLEGREAAAVDELGEAYRTRTSAPERAVEALARGGGRALGGQLVAGSGTETVWIAPAGCQWIPRRERCAAAWGRRGCGCGRARRGVQERDARASSGGASREEDAARGQLVGGERTATCMDWHRRCRGFEGGGAVGGRCLGAAAEAAGCGRALGEAVQGARRHERAVEARSRGGGRRSRSACRGA